MHLVLMTCITWQVFYIVSGNSPGQPLSVPRIWAKGGGKSILEHLRESGSPASD